jgi:PBP1b-binding outer membrane lipoprotein LpoB
MKKTFILIISALVLSACHHETIEERAQRETKEYTQKFCPTPFINYTRTDSMTFENATRTIIYYCSFSDKMDNADIIEKNSIKIVEGLKKGISDNTGIKNYIDAGLNFRYVVHSHKNPQEVLFKHDFKNKDIK